MPIEGWGLSTLFLIYQKHKSNQQIHEKGCYLPICPSPANLKSNAA